MSNPLHGSKAAAAHDGNRTGQYAGVPPNPPHARQRSWTAAMEPLLLLLGLLVVFTGTGWRVVVLPLFFLAFRLLMVLVWGGLTVGSVMVVADRAFGPLPASTIALLVILRTFFSVATFVLWRTRSWRAKTFFPSPPRPPRSSPPASRWEPPARGSRPMPQNRGVEMEDVDVVRLPRAPTPPVVRTNKATLDGPAMFAHPVNQLKKDVEGFRIAVANFAALGSPPQARALSEPSEYQSGEPEGLRKRVASLPRLSPRAMATRLRELGYRGQEEAMQAACVMAYRHVARLRRLYLEGEKPETLGPRQNVLFMGPSGCGKSHLVELLFENILKVPTVTADATQFVETGYVGESLQNLLTRSSTTPPAGRPRVGGLRPHLPR